MFHLKPHKMREREREPFELVKVKVKDDRIYIFFGSKGNNSAFRSVLCKFVESRKKYTPTWKKSEALRS